MSASVTISRRYRGPPNSGNGGYVCGVMAEALGGSHVEVTLLAPPPLQLPLTLDCKGDEATLLDGARTIAVARVTDEPLTIADDAPPAVGYLEAVDAAAVFDVDAYQETHEYPGCYTCGPDRDEGDGLRIFPAATDRPDRYVWPWTPAPSLFGGSGDLHVAVVWAALDLSLIHI